VGHLWDLSMIRLGALCFALCAAVAMPRLADAQTAAADVAAQVRLQGHRCDKPVTARRNLRRSRADSAVWILRCRNASYRVRLDPDMGARVTKLNNK
jgi:hypothetical protein